MYANINGITQNVTTNNTGSVAITNPIPGGWVRVAVSQDTYVEWGAAPTATTQSYLVNRQQPEIIRIGQGNRVAGRAVSSTTAVMSVTPIDKSY